MWLFECFVAMKDEVGDVSMWKTSWGLPLSVRWRVGIMSMGLV